MPVCCEHPPHNGKSKLGKKHKGGDNCSLHRTSTTPAFLFFFLEATI
jgi:hypothetical protein